MKDNFSAKKYVKKTIIKARICLVAIFALLAFFSVTLILHEYIIFGLMYFLPMSFVCAPLVIWIIYLLRYSQISKNIRWLKRINLENIIDDKEYPWYMQSVKIHFGENAFLSEKSGIIIPYSQIAWAYFKDDQINTMIIRTKDGCKFHFSISNVEFNDILRDLIKQQNPDLIIGGTKDKKQQYFSEYKSSLQKHQRQLITIGLIITLFAAFLATVGIINQTVGTTGLCIIGGIGVAGAVMMLIGAKYAAIRDFFSRLISKIQSCKVLDTAFKVFVIIYGCSIGLLLLFAALEIEIMITICLITFCVSLIPFFASIFLKMGYFKEETKPRRYYFGPKKSSASKSAPPKKEVVKPKPHVPIYPIVFEDQSVYINTKDFLQWLVHNEPVKTCEKTYAIPLCEKTPVISIFEDEVKTQEYVLETKENEDFTGKYFHISVRLHMRAFPFLIAMQVDGFISDTAEPRRMELSDIGYRMEGRFLKFGQDIAEDAMNKVRGQDLIAKGLKYPGYTTPSNVRLIGVCPECGKSFTFNGYAFYMSQYDVAYSDDGLDVCTICSYNIDKDNWSYEEDGKIFRYYNSFNCPHCKTPYIDYNNNREIKQFGVSGCVLLGRKYYKEKTN